MYPACLIGASLSIVRGVDVSELAGKSDPSQQVYFVPAFVGLGAPHWDADARGAIFGITRGTTASEVSRAALEAVCYQTRALLDAMRGDWQESASPVVRVDGGMAVSDWTMQFLADILDAPVDRPQNLETTALDAAYLAGLKAGTYRAPVTFAKSWKRGRRFLPKMAESARAAKLAGWHEAVRRTLSK